MSNKLTNDDFLKRRGNFNKNIDILGKYVHSSQKIKVKCKLCGNVWEMLPGNILRGKGCSICAGIKQKTNDEFINELYVINPDILPLTSYKRAQEKIMCKCLVCGNIWWVKPTHLLGGHGCNKCKCYSTGERMISNILNYYHIFYIPQYTFDDLVSNKNGKLSYDFYLPNHNLLIEYQGAQHYKASGYLGGEDKFKIQQEHDKLKREYAQKHNINLLEISYKDNVKEKLLSYLETVTTAGF